MKVDFQLSLNDYWWLSGGGAGAGLIRHYINTVLLSLLLLL